MAAETRTSDMLNPATKMLAADLQGTVHLTIAGREVGTDPPVEWCQQAATTWAMYDSRNWPTTRVDERVGTADRAALRFAHTLLFARHDADADLDPEAGTQPTASAHLSQGPE
jgi:hypothetical protein